MEAVTYDDLLYWSQVSPNEEYINGIPLPGYDMFQEGEKNLDVGSTLHYNAYARGYLEAIRDVWESPSPRTAAAESEG